MRSVQLPCSVEELRRLAETGAPLALAGLDGLEPAEALGLLDLFLHDPAVTAPIEPFASLLSAMIHKRETALWDLLPHADAAMDAFLEALPAERPACLACGCFPVCLGYGAWAGSCGTWLALLTHLAGAARELTHRRAVLERTPQGRR